MLNEKIYNCILEIKRPVHIGCGEEFDITNFYITDVGNESYIVYFTSDRLIDKLNENEKNELISQINKNNLFNSFKKINEFAKKYKPDGYKILISPELKSHYDSVMQNIGSNLNMFVIQRTAHLTNNIPYIPGSSIKGFVRTAYLNSIQEILKNKTLSDYTIYTKRYGNHEKPIYLSNKLEMDLLKGKFSTDPFSYIKISDFMPESDIKTMILYTINFKKGSNEKAKGPYQILECVTSGKFKGSIKIINNEHNKNDIKVLKEACNNFLTETVISEQKDKNIEIEKDNNTINLIIGKYSGKEVVTIKKFRGKNDPTTYWKPAKDKDGKNIIADSFGLVTIKYQ
ncbi:MAG: type III-A CRISPR-associated RAMP protein Csm5 [Elusimicrobia bacterium]|nr:type III-A CRISPR-associated RAMP protein Csm5 [Elusimicrobiota bacterium]